MGQANNKELRPVPLADVRIRDEFWSDTQDLVRQVVIPFQWDALNDRVPGADPSHAIENFRIAAEEASGEFIGMVFQDSDVAKWLEAVGYSLKTHPDAALEEMADSVIALIEKAQQPDGYLNTWFTVKEPGQRWTNLLECHELYSAGHMMEAAVAYFEGTGKRKLLDVMCRFADHADTVFGPDPGKLRGYDGHEEVEIGLVKLFGATGNEKYLNLAKFMIEERGQLPSFFLEDWERHGRMSHWERKIQTQEPNLSYYQAHKPVREQDVAVGHAVRAVYLYTGMADIALKTGDDSLRQACDVLFQNIAEKQMYLTGGIGQTVHGEAFTFDYDLPNDTVYQETCASIGLIFFAHRMLQFGADRRYSDVMERALYNSVISGMAKDGRHFFYVNPLEVQPEAFGKDPGKRHVVPERPHWYGCACCPPNLARLMASLGEYVYSQSADAVFAHLFIGGEADISLLDGDFSLVQETEYPWSGKVRFRLEAKEGGIFPQTPFTFGIRIPGWAQAPTLSVCGASVDPASVVSQGYALLNRIWKAGDTVEMDLDLQPHLVAAHPKVRADIGKGAIQYGPLVYCFEEADNGANLPALSIEVGKELTASFEKDLLGGVVSITAKGLRITESGWEDGDLYRTLPVGGKVHAEIPTTLKAIPYYAWNNRGMGEMAVWLRLRD